MNLDKAYLESKLKFYKESLLNDTLPFWFPESVDHEHGGYLLMRDADGTLLDDDKAVWIQGRAVWLLSTLFNTMEERPEWLAWAKTGYDFLNEHCFDSDGQMFFHVTRDGLPIRKRRYYFSETFYVTAAGAYAKATGDGQAADNSRRVFGNCLGFYTGKRKLQPKFFDTRPVKSIGPNIILLNTAQILRDTIGDERCDGWIAKWIKEIEDFFVKDDIRCVMEQVAPDGSIINHIDGRTLNPGHAIEGSWFILDEARHRNNDPHLIDLGCRMLDYMWERGWDKEHGGILYFRDVYDRPVQEYWQDMKFWWPHAEAITSTLLAYTLTGDEKYKQWHQAVHDYTQERFRDKRNGAWFGYLHRDGTIAQPAKGNLFKGPFHMPRQEWFCAKLLEDILRDG